MTEPLMPDIDWDVPLPSNLAEALPELSPKEEIEMRARTVKLISDLTGKPLDPTEENRAQAHELMEQVVANKTPPDLTQYPNETLAYLGGMVAMYSGMVVRDLADLKLYVVNKLLQESEHPDGKVRMQAIKALGEIDGVDAFKKRTEVTVKNQSIEEVEKELAETLSKLKRISNMPQQPVTDVQSKVIERGSDATDD
jgi:HEAT repeat protein